MTDKEIITLKAKADVDECLAEIAVAMNKMRDKYSDKVEKVLITTRVVNAIFFVTYEQSIQIAIKDPS